MPQPEKAGYKFSGRLYLKEESMSLSLKDVDIVDLAKAMIKFDEYMRLGNTIDIDGDEEKNRIFRSNTTNIYNTDTERDTGDSGFYGPSL